jgi:hypothetical protein
MIERIDSRRREEPYKDFHETVLSATEQPHVVVKAEAADVLMKCHEPLAAGGK